MELFTLKNSSVNLVLWHIIYAPSVNKSQRCIPTYSWIAKFVIEHFEIGELKILNWRDIFLGIKSSSDKSKCLNSLIILLKFTIFNSRVENNLPTREKKMLKIISDLREENKIAPKAGKLQMHLRKWESIHFD